MAVTIGKLNVGLTLNASGLTTGIDKSKSSIKNFSNDIRNTGREINAFASGNMNRLERSFRKGASGVEQLTFALSALGVGGAAGSVIHKVGSVSGALINLRGIVVGLAAGFKALTLAMLTTPIGLVATGIGALVAVGVKLEGQTRKMRAAFDEFAKSVKQLNFDKMTQRLGAMKEARMELAKLRDEAAGRDAGVTNMLRMPDWMQGIELARMQMQGFAESAKHAATMVADLRAKSVEAKDKAGGLSDLDVLKRDVRGFFKRQLDLFLPADINSNFVKLRDEAEEYFRVIDRAEAGGGFFERLTKSIRNAADQLPRLRKGILELTIQGLKGHLLNFNTDDLKPLVRREIPAANVGLVAETAFRNQPASGRAGQLAKAGFDKMTDLQTKANQLLGRIENHLARGLV